MRVTALAIPALLLLAIPASAGTGCTHDAPRYLTVPTAGVSRIIVTARAGSLRITGRPALTGVTATGTACSSEPDSLKEIQIVARRKGSDLLVETVIPERAVIFGWWEARLDLELAVPAGLPLQVTDGSGSAAIEGTGPLEVVDGSGALEIRDIRGNVEVEDSSGEISISGVAGDITLEDGSGSISIENVKGSVRVSEDGSGSIEIRNVARDVTILDDGSGSIDVSDIKGDFTVESDGSGGIEMARVGGRVRLPK